MAYMGRNHLHLLDHKVRQTVSGHLPLGFHLQDWQGCFPAQRASWCHCHFCHKASTAQHSHGKFLRSRECSWQHSPSQQCHQTWQTFFPSSSVWPRPTHTFLVVFIPRAYITSPRKKRSSSPLPSQSYMSHIFFTASASTILNVGDFLPL